LNDNYHIGLDTHHRSSTLCILGANGQEVKTLTLRGGGGGWDRVLATLRGLDGPIALCYEASIGYGTLYDKLAKVCSKVVVAHPGRLRLIFRSKRKNDRVDARKLAKLLYLDEVPQVHVPSIDVRGWRELIETRRRTIDKRTRAKNGLRALLRGLGISSPTNLWTKKGRAWLEELELPTPTARLRREMLCEEIDHLDRQIVRITRELDRLASLHPGVALLMTIPGIGPRTAEAFLAYVDDPNRFAKTRRVGAYFGLVPSQDASGGVNRLGHITKEGPATVRKLLVEAGWRAVRCCPNLRGCFDRITAGKRDRRKTALVAVAHKLSRTMLAMLKSGEVYRVAA
jgi:transposase